MNLFGAFMEVQCKCCKYSEQCATADSSTGPHFKEQHAFYIRHLEMLLFFSFRNFFEWQLKMQMLIENLLISNSTNLCLHCLCFTPNTRRVSVRRRASVHETRTIICFIISYSDKPKSIVFKKKTVNADGGRALHCKLTFILTTAACCCY